MLRACKAERVFAAVCSALMLSLAAASTALAAQPAQLAILGVFLQNDNEAYEPTSSAEKARVKMVEDQFAKMLAASGQYRLVAVPEDMRAQIANGQPLGACGGCEGAFGKTLGTDQVSWITVQKISNLILNMNVYVADVPSGRLQFIHSVDIRGNTDETWSRSLKYLVQYYMLKSASGG